jgi:hypothetical protein
MKNSFIWTPRQPNKMRLNYLKAAENERKLFNGRIQAYRCCECKLLIKRVLFHTEKTPKSLTCRCGGLAKKLHDKAEVPMPVFKTREKSKKQTVYTWEE